MSELVSPPVAHRFVHVNGLRLHLLDFGGAGHTVLLMHGVLGHSWMWYDVAPALTEIGHVVALDFRGYGDSQWSPEEQYATSDHAKDVEAILTLLDGGAADLVGFSSGGLVALELAVRRPELVRRVVMVDIPPASAQSETDVPPIAGEYAGHREALAAERRLSPRAGERMLEVMASFGTRAAAGGMLARKHDSLFLHRWPFRSDQLWAQVAALEMPLLIVRASDSAVLSPADAERMQAFARNATLVEVPDSGHLVAVEQPHALAAAFRAFLAITAPSVVS